MTKGNEIEVPDLSDDEVLFFRGYLYASKAYALTGKIPEKDAPAVTWEHEGIGMGAETFYTKRAKELKCKELGEITLKLYGEHGSEISSDVKGGIQSPQEAAFILWENGYTDSRVLRAIMIMTPEEFVKFKYELWELMGK